MSADLDRYISTLEPGDQPVARAHGEVAGDVWRARFGPKLDSMADVVLGNGGGKALDERLEHLSAQLEEMRRPWWRRAALGLGALGGAVAAGFFGRGGM